MRTLRRRRQKGQAFVEYVILVAVIALAALFALANFSDRIKDMINGITVTLGGEADDRLMKNPLTSSRIWTEKVLKIDLCLYPQMTAPELFQTSSGAFCFYPEKNSFQNNRILFSTMTCNSPSLVQY